MNRRHFLRGGMAPAIRAVAWYILDERAHMDGGQAMDCCGPTGSAATPRAHEPLPG